MGIIAQDIKLILILYDVPLIFFSCRTNTVGKRLFFQFSGMNFFPSESNNWITRFAPIFYWVTVLIFDWAEPYGTVAAPLLTIGLFFFCTFLSVRWMVVWAALYTLTVLLVLYYPSVSCLVNDGRPINDLFQKNFRFAGFTSVAAFACYFSYMLGRLRAHHNSLNHLVSSMPLPVIVSNPEGKIMLLNDEARAFMKIDETLAIESLNYFELLAPKTHRGKCIAEYIKAFKHDHMTQLNIELEFNGQRLTGHLEVLEGKKQDIITILTPA
jgi:PAS domain-containing protein